MTSQLNFCSSSVYNSSIFSSIFASNKNFSKKNRNSFATKKRILCKSSINSNNSHRLKKIGALILGFNLSINPMNVRALPEEKPQTKIIDEAGLLTKSSISYIEKSTSKIKENNGTEIYFVSLRNLPYDQNAQEYAKELFFKWNLGEKDVLVVLASKVAKAGVFFGTQVNGLDDTVIKSIGEETYSFKAKEEQYSSAALDVNNRLVSILSNKGDPGPPILNRSDSSSNFKSAKNTEEQRSKYVAVIIILLIIAFVVPMFQFFWYVKDE